MKKKIQKYLAGEREGFSLVELIIVIAIMAILIGVIALAVIPNIQKSRESKDLQTLDNVLAAANTAVANAKIAVKDSKSYAIPLTKAGDYKCPADDTSGDSSTTGGPAGFQKSFNDAISGTISLGSTNAVDQDITILLTPGRVEVYIAGDQAVTGASSDAVKAAKCERTMDDKDASKEALYYVTN